MVKKIILFSISLASFFIIYTTIILFLFKWIDLPTSAFIQVKSPVNILTISPTDDYSMDWVPYEKINKNIVLAVIASEDQKFIDHFGFDLDQISKAVEDKNMGKRLRGASTITQQTAKNIFLWGGKDYIRKGFEVYYSLMLELLWDKKRIIEVYLNIAEFGKNIYGIEAASVYYFNKSASNLNRGQASILAAILPNPIKYDIKKPTNYLLKRSEDIIKQMENLGGIGYLNSIE